MDKEKSGKREFEEFSTGFSILLMAIVLRAKLYVVGESTAGQPQMLKVPKTVMYSSIVFGIISKDR